MGLVSLCAEEEEGDGRQRNLMPQRHSASSHTSCLSSSGSVVGSNFEAQQPVNVTISLPNYSSLSDN